MIGLADTPGSTNVNDETVMLCPCEACGNARVAESLRPMVEAMAAEVRGIFEGERAIVFRPLARVVTPEVRFPPLAPEGGRG